MSLVISNMFTDFFPPNTAESAPSALIWRRFFASCNPFFLMYAHTFLVTSVRGSALLPTTAASAALGVIAFMKAAFGVRFAFFAFGLAAAFFFAAFLAAFFFATVGIFKVKKIDFESEKIVTCLWCTEGKSIKVINRTKVIFPLGRGRNV